MQQSPAAAAGIPSGDIIIEFDKKKVDSPQELQKAVALTTPGKGVPVKVWRDKAREDARDQDRRHPRGERGAQAQQQGQEHARARRSTHHTGLARQLNLRSTEAWWSSGGRGERAAEAGMQNGDVIREVNRQRVRGLPDFER